MRNFKLTSIILKIALVISIFVGISCAPENQNKTYNVKLEIHYPSRIDTITVEGQAYEYPTVYSREGTNYVTQLYSTSAPIKIISVTEVDSTNIE